MPVYQQSSTRPRLKVAKRALQGEQQQAPQAQPTQQVGQQAQAPQAPQAQQNTAMARSTEGPRQAPRSLSQVPRGLTGAPTNVTRDNAGDVLSGWARGGGMPGFRVEPSPGDMPGQDLGQTTGDYGGGEDSRSNEEMINDLVRQYLAGGPADTAEQEAIIKKQIEQDLGMDLMNQRAAAGASGFEASGALIGAEGDIRRGANMDATEQILGARSKAEEDAFERAMTAAGLDQDERQMAIDERMRQLQLDALNAWIESQGGEAAGQSGATGPTGSTDNRTDEQKRADDREQNDLAEAYPGGPDAYWAEQEKGYAEVVKYSMQNGGDFSGLPVRSPGPGDVLAHGFGDRQIWYSPATGEIFQAGG